MLPNYYTGNVLILTGNRLDASSWHEIEASIIVSQQGTHGVVNLRCWLDFTCVRADAWHLVTHIK